MDGYAKTLYPNDRLNKQIINFLNIKHSLFEDSSNVIYNNITNIISSENIKTLNEENAKYLGVSTEYFESKLNNFNLEIHSKIVKTDGTTYRKDYDNCTGKTYKSIFNDVKELSKDNQIMNCEIAIFKDNQFVCVIKPDKNNLKKDSIGDTFPRMIYEEIKYQDRFKLSKIEKLYLENYNKLWNDYLKQNQISIEENELNNELDDIEFDI